MKQKNYWLTATILTVILCFVVGLPVFYTVFKIFPPLTDAEVEQYTLVASDIYYNQMNNKIFDVPEDYDVEIDATSITVKPGGNQWSRGTVTCRLENGTLIANYNKNTLDIIWISTLITAFLCVFLIIIFSIISDAIEKMIDKSMRKTIIKARI